MGAGLLAAIAGLAGPILHRVIFALGFASVTFLGIQAVVGQLKSLMFTHLGNAASAGIQIAGLAGIWSGLGMMLGAVTFTVSLWALTKAVRIVNK